MMRTLRILALCLIVAAPLACSQQPDETAVPPRSRVAVEEGRRGPSVRQPRGLDRDHARQLMPLEVGNRWTYRWTSPAAPAGAEVEAEEPIFYGRQISSYQGKSMDALGYRRNARPHEETYSITRLEGDRYFFVISSAPEVPLGQIRDGRYEESQQLSWSWSEDGEVLALSEQIEREWTYPSRQYLLRGSSRAPADFPVDFREVIQLESDHGGRYRGGRRVWLSSRASGDKQMCPVTQHNSRLAEVVVPAGKFAGCMETVVKFFMSEEEIDDSAWGDLFDRADAPLLYETHTYWAPGVGMVREYQKTGDGKLAYDLALLEYDLRQGGSEAPAASASRDQSARPAEAPSPSTSPPSDDTEPHAPAVPAADAGEVWKYHEQSVLVRLRMPPAPMQPWKEHACPQQREAAGGAVIGSFAWFDRGEEVESASKHHVIREAKRERIAADAYLPLQPGRQWVYRREVFASMAVLVTDQKGGRNIETLTRNPCFWRYGTLSNGDAIEERGSLEVVVDVIRASAGDRGDLERVDEYTIALKERVAYGQETAFVVEAFPESSVRDGRYGRRSFNRTLWLRTSGEAGTEFREVTFWTCPPPRSEEIACERAMLFDAGLSRVRTYAPAGEPSDEVIQGMLVEECPDVIKVLAGEFENTLRVIEYLQPRGAGERGQTRPLTLPGNHMDYGWITIAWYAPGVGLVKEEQYLKSGARCYCLELVSTPFDPSYEQAAD